MNRETRIGKLKISEYQGQKTYCFYCPGCNEGHCIDETRWKFDGNYDAPTFTPSVKSWYGENPPPNLPPYCCHLYIKEGRIEFLADCTHSLAGKTVDLPDYPENYG